MKKLLLGAALALALGGVAKATSTNNEKACSAISQMGKSFAH